MGFAFFCSDYERYSLHSADYFQSLYLERIPECGSFTVFFGMFRLFRFLLFSCDPSTSRLPEKIAVIRTLASVKPVDGYRHESPLDTTTSAEIARGSSSRTVNVYFYPGLPLQRVSGFDFYHAGTFRLTAENNDAEKDQMKSGPAPSVPHLFPAAKGGINKAVCPPCPHCL